MGRLEFLRVADESADPAAAELEVAVLELIRERRYLKLIDLKPNHNTRPPDPDEDEDGIGRGFEITEMGMD